jgi:osmotically-inducible protein OsmY
MNNVSELAQVSTEHLANHARDSDLAAAAADAIACLTTVPIDTIQVSAQDGRLHLEGWVDSDSERIIVEEVIRPLRGVRGVINSVKVGDIQSRVPAAGQNKKLARHL